MSAIITTNKVRREAVDATLSSQKVQLIYRPETHSMAEVTAAVVAAAASGEMVYLGPGEYVLNINLPNGGSAGFGITGAGRNRTFLISAVANTPVFACQGLWYCRFVGLSFSHHSLGAGTMPAVDIDGKTGENARGVQGNTWQDCSFSGRGWFDGLLGHSAFWMCRVAVNAGQGSENCFINCHFNAATFACVLITGYNALNNQFYGGNVQTYTKHGMFFQAGSFHVYNMGFQSTTDIQQIDNDGWDIWANGGGVGDSVSVFGCRTESLRFMLGNPAQPPVIMNCLQNPAVNEWFPNYPYVTGNAFYHLDTTTQIRSLYRVTSNFTSGATFSVTAQMQLVTFNVIDSIAGTEINNNWSLGNIGFFTVPGIGYKEIGTGNTDQYYATYRDKHITVDCSLASKDVHLFNAQLVPAGYEVVVTRADNVPANICRVGAAYFDNDPANVFYHELFATPTGRSQRFVALGFGFARRWYRCT